MRKQAGVMEWWSIGVLEKTEVRQSLEIWILLQSLGKFFHFLLQFVDSALDLVQGCSHLLVLNGG
jgi:hypothetical protein